jgi:hypothetical protein
LEAKRPNATSNERSQEGSRVLENNSKKGVMVWSPEWEAGAWEVQREQWARLQIENHPGSWKVGPFGDWVNPEATEGYVKPGYAFCACISLNRNEPDDELRRRLVLENLGTMVIPLEIAGKKRKWRIRL